MTDEIEPYVYHKVVAVKLDLKEDEARLIIELKKDSYAEAVLAGVFQLETLGDVPLLINCAVNEKEFEIHRSKGIYYNASISYGTLTLSQPEEEIVG